MNIARILKACQSIAQQGGLSPPFHCARGAMCCGCIFDYVMDSLKNPATYGDVEFVNQIVKARSNQIGGALVEAVTAEEAVNFFERLKLCQN